MLWYGETAFCTNHLHDTNCLKPTHFECSDENSVHHSISTAMIFSISQFRLNLIMQGERCRQQMQPLCHKKLCVPDTVPSCSLGQVEHCSEVHAGGSPVDKLEGHPLAQLCQHGLGCCRHQQQNVSQGFDEVILHQGLLRAGLPGQTRHWGFQKGVWRNQAKNEASQAEGHHASLGDQKLDNEVQDCC